MNRTQVRLSIPILFNCTLLMHSTPNSSTANHTVTLASSQMATYSTTFLFSLPLALARLRAIATSGPSRLARMLQVNLWWSPSGAKPSTILMGRGISGTLVSWVQSLAHASRRQLTRTSFVAIELSGRDRFGGPARGIEPNRGLVFRYPSVLELDDYDVTGTICALRFVSSSLAGHNSLTAFASLHSL